MLVARGSGGGLVEASRDLEGDGWECPSCGGGLVFKRGRVKVAHFAHARASTCAWASESAAHLAAKRVLADNFRAAGYQVVVEQAFPAVGRRVDVAVEAGVARIAVEVQDSAIGVGEAKERMRLDRRCGFQGTLWVFTAGRARHLLEAGPGEEVRVPDEMRWLANRFGAGVFVLDPGAGRVWECSLDDVVRPGGSAEWREPGGVMNWVSYGDRKLRTVKTVVRFPAAFTLGWRRSRYWKPQSQELVPVFTALP